MPLKIIQVQPRSQAAKAGIRAQDTLVAINGAPINDFFDLQYYANDFRLELELLDAAGEARSITLERLPNKTLGIEPEAYSHKVCRNRCVFCFIDQMPPALRPSLYQKDDDYLLSYVFGNYITLTNLRQKELDRIARQHISPLYVSVHAADPALRAKLMGYEQETDVLATLAALSAQGIEFHIQIVCVPGYNDGPRLRETLAALLDGKINILSIGIVPVGLTRHRRNLAALQPLKPAQARATLAIASEFSAAGHPVQVADEIFVQAGESIPEPDYYGDFPQLENGIGMLSLTLANFQKKKRSFAKELEKSGNSFLILTAASAESTLQGIAGSLRDKSAALRIRVQALRNDFFGPRISVTGLLTAADILAQQQAGPKEAVILPSNLFNSDGLTLDGVSQIELKTRLERPLLVVDQLFEDWDWL